MAVRIKRYEGRVVAMDELLDRIEREMGPEAQLETREFKRGGLLGIGGTRMVEIIATLDVQTQAASTSGSQAVAKTNASMISPAQPAIAAPASLEASPGTKAPASVKAESQAVVPAPSQRVSEAGKLATSGLQGPPSSGDENHSALNGELQAVRSGLDDLRGAIQTLAEGQAGIQALAQEAVRTAAMAAKAAEDASRAAAPVDASEPASRQGLTQVQVSVSEVLQSWNISAADSLALIESVAKIGTDILQRPGHPAQRLNQDALLGLITREICSSILLAGGIAPPQPGQPAKVVALVGPTGVGKTTSIAKLAAHFAFNQGKKVALVSLDNYRIAAAEQLRTYAEIIGIPLSVVFSAAEYVKALDGFASFDLVFVDTAGRSPLNAAQVADLTSALSARPPDEVHLVVAATTKSDDLAGILEGFEPLRYNRAIVSKLDETRSLGCIFNINKLANVPMSYFAVGQSVPEDLRAAELNFIQAWIDQGRVR